MQNKIKIEYYEETGTMAITIKDDASARTEEHNNDITIDYNLNNEIISISIDNIACQVKGGLAIKDEEEKSIKNREKLTEYLEQIITYDLDCNRGVYIENYVDPLTKQCIRQGWERPEGEEFAKFVESIIKKMGYELRPIAISSLDRINGRYDGVQMGKNLFISEEVK